MNEWPTVRLGDLAASSRNALVGGPFGSNLTTSDFVAAGVRVIQGKNMGRRWLGGTFVYVSPEKAESLRANIARPGDVIFTQRGTLGQVSLAPLGGPEAYVVSQSQMKLTVDRAIADPTFVYYAFTSPDKREYMFTHAIRTGVPHTNLGILREATLLLPPLAEQRAISSMLGALDDKIEANWRLERLAQDFRDEMYASTIAQPWPTAALSSVVWVNRAKRQPGPDDEELEYIDIAGVDPGYVTEVRRMAWRDAPGRARRSVQDGDVIFSTVRPERRSHALILDPPPATVVSTGFATLTPTGVGPAYLSAVAADDSFADFLSASAEGSAYPAVSPESMGRFELPLPSAEKLSRFEADVLPLLRVADRARRESKTLAALRDALLPELLSGRLGVPAVQEQVEAVV